MVRLRRVVSRADELVAAAAVPAASYADAAVVAAEPRVTPLVFVQITAPADESVQSPEMVCGAKAVPPELPMRTCPAAGAVAEPVPPLDAAIGVEAVSVVKAPVEGVVAPMVALLMVPEVIAATALLPPPEAPLNPVGEKL